MWSDRSLRMSTQRNTRTRTRAAAIISGEAARDEPDTRAAAEEVRAAARREELESRRSLDGGNLEDEPDNLGNHNTSGTEPEDGLGAEGSAGEPQPRDPGWSAGQRGLLRITLIGVSNKSVSLNSPASQEFNASQFIWAHDWALVEALWAHTKLAYKHAHPGWTINAAWKVLMQEELEKKYMMVAELQWTNQTTRGTKLIKASVQVELVREKIVAAKCGFPRRDKEEMARIVREQMLEDSSFLPSHVEPFALQLIKLQKKLKEKNALEKIKDFGAEGDGTA